MMINTVFGTKVDVTQKFTEDGRRIPVTRIKTGPSFVVQIKHEGKNGYNAVQVGWGEKKLRKIKKPLKGHLKGAKTDKAPLFLSEIKVDNAADYKIGDKIEATKVLKPGDKVKVTGWSKGRGFTGVVKRWGFAGGPRTHGQSDRERAPGSIGQTTTPGRVFKGKKMAGRSGGTKITVFGLTVMAVDPNGLLLVKGLVPGSSKSQLVINKVGQEKRFVPLLKPGEMIIKGIGEEKIKKTSTKNEVGEKEPSGSGKTRKRPMITKKENSDA